MIAPSDTATSRTWQYLAGGDLTVNCAGNVFVGQMAGNNVTITATGTNGNIIDAHASATAQTVQAQDIVAQRQVTLTAAGTQGIGFFAVPGGASTFTCLGAGWPGAATCSG